jgi:hypothetical protein
MSMDMNMSMDMDTDMDTHTDTNTHTGMYIKFYARTITDDFSNLRLKEIFFNGGNDQFRIILIKFRDILILAKFYRFGESKFRRNARKFCQISWNTKPEVPRNKKSEISRKFQWPHNL